MIQYKYRFPGTTEVISGETGCTPHNGDLGFICRPFGYENGPKYGFPQHSTTRQEHRLGVEKILHAIHAGEVTKCVLSRAIVKAGEIDVQATFSNLCEAYPTAFVFWFRSDVDGEWMGASPELLLKAEGRNVSTMALAGTRPRTSSCDSIKPADEPEWDEKNIREQKHVTEYIVQKLSESGLDIKAGNTSTYAAGPVEHLMTPITVSCSGQTFTTAAERIRYGLCLANRLSPTPAVAGLPVENALELIENIEKFPRSCYGGFCGPTYPNGDFAFYVNLRSMQIESGKYCLYAGGGIVAGSDPDQEWEETERKASTLLNKIVTKIKHK